MKSSNENLDDSAAVVERRWSRLALGLVTAVCIAGLASLAARQAMRTSLVSSVTQPHGTIEIVTADGSRKPDVSRSADASGFDFVSFIPEGAKAQFAQAVGVDPSSLEMRCILESAFAEFGGRTAEWGVVGPSESDRAVLMEIAKECAQG